MLEHRTNHRLSLIFPNQQFIPLSLSIATGFKIQFQNWWGGMKSSSSR